MKTKPSGFTIIELLIVITIIALIAGIAAPVIRKLRNKPEQHAPAHDRD